MQQFKIMQIYAFYSNHVASLYFYNLTNILKTLSFINLVLTFVQAYNVLAAQIEQTRQLGQKLEAKILDVRDVDVSVRLLSCA